MKAPLNRLSSADPFGLSGAFLGTTGLDKKFHTPGGAGFLGRGAEILIYFPNRIFFKSSRFNSGLSSRCQNSAQVGWFGCPWVLINPPGLPGGSYRPAGANCEWWPKRQISAPLFWSAFIPRGNLHHVYVFFETIGGLAKVFIARAYQHRGDKPTQIPARTHGPKQFPAFVMRA